MITSDLYKFRGKVNKDFCSNHFKQRFVYGSVIYAEDDKTSTIFGDEFEADVDTETVTQFTGLYDKNKVEVYDGDIVEVTNKGVYNGLKVVKFDPILLGYVLVNIKQYNEEWNSQSGGTYLRVSSGIKCIVRGNLFDNPLSSWSGIDI